MKNIKTFSFLFMFVLIAACSSDDNSTSMPTEPDPDTETDPDTDTDTDTETESTFTADITEISVVNSLGEIPKKGDEISISLSITNSGNSSGTVDVSPKITSNRFEDFERVSVPPVEVSLEAGETKSVDILVGPFLVDDQTEKIFAMNRGEYEIDVITIDDMEDTEFEGGTFNIETSNRILVPVLYDPAYLEMAMYTEDIQNYLNLAFTRTVEVFDNGNSTVYEGGVDEMVGVEHLFFPISTINIADYEVEGDLCVKSTALAAEELGLVQSWAGPVVGTQAGNHGFDYLISLTPNAVGGVFCESRSGTISGTNNTDVSVKRLQLTMAHQTGHIFGAQHCDASQEFVMCAGENNPKYINEDIFVFDIASSNMMENRFE